MIIDLTTVNDVNQFNLLNKKENVALKYKRYS